MEIKKKVKCNSYYRNESSFRSIEILSHQGLNEDQMIIIKAAANQLGNALERELTYLEQEK